MNEYVMCMYNDFARICQGHWDWDDRPKKKLKKHRKLKKFVKNDLPINIDGSEPLSPTTPEITTDCSIVNKYVEENGDLTVTTVSETTDDTPLGNTFLKRVQTLRENFAEDVQKAKETVVQLADKADDAISVLGSDLASKLDDLDGTTLSSMSSNWNLRCQEKHFEETRREQAQKAHELLAIMGEDKIVSVDFYIYLINWSISLEGLSMCIEQVFRDKLL